MKMIDAAAVEALKRQVMDDAWDDPFLIGELDALLATAVEAEPVADDGLTEVESVVENIADGELYFIRTGIGAITDIASRGKVGIETNDREILLLNTPNGEFGSIPAARAALAAALQGAVG